MDHIFTNKLNNVYELDEIKAHNLPKPEIELGFSLDSKKGNKQNQFTIKQRSRKNLEVKKGVERGGQEGALGRREKAKNNLEFRRKKLEQMLRTLW